MLELNNTNNLMIIILISKIEASKSMIIREFLKNIPDYIKIKIEENYLKELYKFLLYPSPIRMGL